MKNPHISRMDLCIVITKVLLFKIVYRLVKYYILWTRKDILTYRQAKLEARHFFIYSLSKKLTNKLLKVCHDHGFPEMLNNGEEIVNLVRDGYSISRFGDGENFVMLSDDDSYIYFQKSSSRLKEKLKEVLAHPIEKHILGMYTSHAYVGIFYENIFLMFTRMHKTLFKTRVPLTALFGQEILDLYKNAHKNYVLCRSNVFIHTDRSPIWENKDVLFVTGPRDYFEARMRNGASTIEELFATAKSLDLIEAPATNAFDIYDELIEKIKERGKGKIIILSLGMTATVAAYDLSKAGYHAVDIGQFMQRDLNIIIERYE